MLSLTFKGQTKSDKLTEKLRPSKRFKETHVFTPQRRKINVAYSQQSVICIGSPSVTIQLHRIKTRSLPPAPMGDASVWILTKPLIWFPFFSQLISKLDDSLEAITIPPSLGPGAIYAECI